MTHDPCTAPRIPVRSPRVASIGAALCWLLMLMTPSVEAQDNLADIASPRAIEELRATVESRADLPEESRNSLLQQLDAGRAYLDAEAGHRQQASQFRAAADSAEHRITEFRDKATAPRDELRLADDATAADASATELDSKIDLLRGERAALADRRNALQLRLDQALTRVGEIQQRLAAISARVEENMAALAVPANTLEQKVDALVRLAENRGLLAERERLETEVLTEPARTGVAAAERAWIEGALVEYERTLAAVQKAAELARAKIVQQKLDSAADLESELYGEQPALLTLAESNRQLAENLQQISQSLASATERREEMGVQLESIKQQSALMQRRLEAAGHKVVLASVMVELLYDLPDIRSLDQEIQRRSNEIGTSSLVAIDTEESLRELARREDFLKQWLPESVLQDPQAMESAEKLLQLRQRLLQETRSSLTRLQQGLIEGNQIANALVQEINAFEQFLSGNLLWVRSYSTLEPTAFFAQLGSLLAVDQWRQFPRLLLEGWRRDQWAAALLVMLPIVWVLARRLRKPYLELMTRPTPLSGENLRNIALGLGMSLVLVLPWPLLLHFIARSLSMSGGGGALAQAVAPAALSAAVLLYWLLLAGTLVGKRGVCRRFLKNDARKLDALREELRWAMPVGLVAYFLNRFAYYLDVTSSGGPLGALCITVVAAVILAVAARLLRRDVFREVGRVRLALKLTVAGGMVVIALQALGLLFAADEVMEAFLSSILVVLLVTFCIDILKRWLLILRFRLERKVRGDLRPTDAMVEEGDEALEAMVEQAPGELDVLRLSEAHDRLLELLRTVSLVGCLWVIWSPLLPAFGLLESVALWTTTNTADPAGVLTVITLFDLSIAIFILVVTALVAKYLPAMVQVMMLEWFQVSAGARYATGMLMQYVVIAVGLSLCMSRVGWEWARVQWLVAALGVGIGFGLQEIVANFISGIIVLFERPVRVGDVITVGGAEGTVLRISARATLIETFDRKEVLIPNKQLITEQVTNWSLTDAAVRILIPVGIAYGSDVRLARRLLLEAANAVELVLDEPEPQASFDDFGDNALLLTLRCYASENRLQAWTQLREEINDKFTAAGISIAFPQQDVHLDMGQPLRIQWDQLPPLQPGEGGAEQT